MYLWQLPQNIIGLMLLGYFKLNKSIKLKRKMNKLSVYSIKVLVKDNYYQGISLGNYIFIESDANGRTIQHEIGHSKQSKILGPFYIVIVGIPSLILASLTRISPTILNNYYKFFPENWADKLGGVNRNEEN